MRVFPSPQLANDVGDLLGAEFLQVLRRELHARHGVSNLSNYVMACLFHLPSNEAITAWATLGAVLVALLWEPCRRWWNRPILKVTWRKRDSETRLRDDRVTEDTWVRLFVENVGRSAAESVELTISEVFRREADSPAGLVEGFLPISLIWTHSDSADRKRIAPRSFRLCNLGCYQQRSYATGPAETTFTFDTEVQPTTKFNVLNKGSYIVRILATAANCQKADHFKVGINVGLHRVDGEKLDFSMFDEEQLKAGQMASSV